MKLLNYKDNTLTIENLFKLCLENDFKNNFIFSIMEYSIPIKKIYKLCIDNDAKILSLEILEDSIKLKTTIDEKILKDIPYILIEDDYITLSNTFYYSKLVNNYNKNLTPYINNIEDIKDKRIYG